VTISIKNNLFANVIRPVSILPTISKVYEMVLSDQLTDLFENIFHAFLCAFRKGHGCQTTLLRLLEDWKTALDKNQYVTAIRQIKPFHKL
jgi:retron-type reverse transcriptase